MSKIESLLQMLKEANGIKGTNYTWETLGQEVGLSGNAMRHRWRRYKKKKNGLINFCVKNGIDVNSVKRASLSTKGKWSVSVQPSKQIDLSNIKINTVASNWKPDLNLNNTQTLVVNMTDQHIGMTIEKGVFDIEWNIDIYEERLKVVLDYISKESFDKIVINMLGDYIDGQDRTTARRSHLLSQDMNNEEMLKSGVNSFLQFISNLEYFNVPIEVNAITSSNHGGYMEYSIWYTIQKYCKVRYSHFVKINICNQFLQHTTIGKYNVILTHGYDDAEVSSRNKMPKDIKPVWENKIGRYIKHYNLKNVILLRGDLHQYKDTKFSEFRDFLIPSFCNSSGHIQHNYLSDSQGGFVLQKWSDVITSTYIEFE